MNMWNYKLPFFWYKPIFMVFFLAMQFALLFFVKRKTHFALRYLAYFFLCIGFSFLLPVNETFSLTWWYSSLVFLFFLLLAIFGCRIAYDIPISGAAFYALAAYTIQHICQEVYDVLVIFLGNGRGNFYTSGAIDFSGIGILSYLLYLLLILVIFTSSFLIFQKRIKAFKGEEYRSPYIPFIAAVMVIFDILVSSLATYAVVEDSTSQLLKILCHIADAFVCVLALILLFELPSRIKAEKDLLAQRLIYERDRRNYSSYMENMEVIREKVHDLKYLIRTMQDQSLSDQTRRQIEEAIEIYDTYYDTGNACLDVLLAEKGLYCVKKGISYSVMAEAKQLKMENEDVYTIFGNLLDNAVEACAQCPEGKFVSLSVKPEKNFIVISCFNSFQGEIVFEHGLPKTTKSNEREHGFGLKSIKNTVAKYSGELSISTQEGVFKINIILPIQSR